MGLLAREGQLYEMKGGRGFTVGVHGIKDTSRTAKSAQPTVSSHNKQKTAGQYARLFPDCVNVHQTYGHVKDDQRGFGMRIHLYKKKCNADAYQATQVTKETKNKLTVVI